MLKQDYGSRAVSWGAYRRPRTVGNVNHERRVQTDMVALVKTVLLWLASGLG